MKPRAKEPRAKAYTLEMFNDQDPRRVDIAVHISGEPPAHLVFEDFGSKGIWSHEGRPLNEEGVNGFVPPDIFDQAEKKAIAHMRKLRDDYDLRLFY